MRTTLADRPGTLAALARHCGEEGVNILGLQIFPGVGGVTDELVLRCPDGWPPARVSKLVEAAGGTEVVVARCTEHALRDGPIHYLHALRRVAHDPGTLPDMLARLLDAEPTSAVATPEGDPADDMGTLSVHVGPQHVLLRRTAPFTATEHARAVAFADVAAELIGPTGAPGLHDAEEAGPSGRLLERAYEAVAGPAPSTSPVPVVRLAAIGDTPALVRMHVRCSSESVYRRYAAPLTRVDDRFARRLLLSGGGALVAVVDGEVVGYATVSTTEEEAAEVALLVEDGWQRHGLGARLLSSAARLARGRGAEEIVLRSRGHNPALMSLAFASGLRARIKLDGDTVVVIVGVNGVRPLATVPAETRPGAGSPTPSAGG
ncbi:MAG: GNAT family N-acetyltransferase [Nocardioidaceae bacterium]